MSLHEAAATLLRGPRQTPSEVEQLVIKCIDEMSSGDAIAAVELLFKDAYGGGPQTSILKMPGAFGLVAWGDTGLRALSRAALEDDVSFKSRRLALEVLAALDAGIDLETFLQQHDYSALGSRIAGVVRSLPDLRRAARLRLRDFLLSIEDERDVAILVGTEFSTAALIAQEILVPLVRAVAVRWMAVSEWVIGEFERLIETKPDDEPAFQEFLERWPQLLDPMARVVWPRPDLHGAKEPDFVIQRFDGSYVVVEIECPGKSLMTQANHLGAEVTKAVAQVTDYDGFMNERLEAMRKLFPGIIRRELLVAIGREDVLTEEQDRAFRQHLQHSHVRIVGFDWLARRARQVLENALDAAVEVRRDGRVT